MRACLPVGRVSAGRHGKRSYASFGPYHIIMVHPVIKKNRQI